MATAKQVAALIKAHKKVEAAGLPGLVNADPAVLDLWTNEQVDAAFKKLNCIPASDAQVSFIISILGGLGKIPDEVAEAVRALTKYDALKKIPELKGNYAAQRAFIEEHTAVPVRRMLWDLDSFELEPVFERCYSQVEELDRKLMSSAIPDLHRARLLDAWEEFKLSRRVITLEEIASAPQLAVLEKSEPELSVFGGIEL